MRKVLQLAFSKNIRNVFSKVSAMPLSLLGNVNSDRNILSAQFYTKWREARESLIWFLNLSWVSQYLLKRDTDFIKPTFLAREFFFRKWSNTFENIELRKKPLAKVQTATSLLRFWCNFISFNLLICKDLRISGAGELPGSPVVGPPKRNVLRARFLSPEIWFLLSPEIWFLHPKVDKCGHK